MPRIDKRIPSCLVGLFACVGSAAVAQTQALSSSTLHSLAEREVDKLVALYSDGFASEVRRLRHISNGPLFTDAPEALVVYFVLQGADLSNTHQEFVAIFGVGRGRDLARVQGPRERPLHLVATAMVGSRRTRTLDPQSVQIAPGKVSIAGLRWIPGDPGCCPSEPIQVTWSLPPTLLSELSVGTYPVLSETVSSNPKPTLSK